MSTHNICFCGEIRKQIILNYHLTTPLWQILRLLWYLQCSILKLMLYPVCACTHILPYFFLVFQWNLLLNLFCTFFYMYIYCRFSGFKFRKNTQWAISFPPLFMCTFLKLFMEHILQVGIAVAPSITDHLLPMFDDFLARYHQVSNVSFKK